MVKVLDSPDDPSNLISDIIQSLVTLFFVLEITACSIGQPRYVNGTFFWMDILGTLSMAFELSFALGPQGMDV